MTRRIPCGAIAAALLAGCASGPPAAPGPDGRRAINDNGALEFLAAETRERAASEYDIAARAERAALFEEPRRFSRETDSEALATLPRTGVVERTVSVRFGFDSTRFMPSAEQAIRMRELFARAERIEVRGRTDGIGTRDGDEMIARKRAEAAKRYLVDRGVPARIVSVGYVAGGDYIADNGRRDGRRKNRRVDIEFVLDDGFRPTADDVAAWHEVSGS